MIYIFILAFWMLWIVLGVNMARNRNRSPWTWGIICGIFGVFGVMAVALFGHNKAPGA